MEAYEKYEVGETYTLKVLDLCKDSSDNDYLRLTDGERELRVYRPLKYQYDDLPAEVPVIVTKIDLNKRIHLVLDTKMIFEQQYTKGKLYSFSIISVNNDPNKYLYYTIEDDFSEHRYYTKDEYNIGDDIILEVNGTDERGFLKLKKPEHYSFEEGTGNVVTSNTVTRNVEEPMLDRWEKAPVLEEAERENNTVEFKTSIAFPPGNNGQADIDKQLDTVIKTLCGFMNSEGGTLYIGVHDRTRRIVGFKDDYAHLNDGEDNFAGKYDESNDHYELKIRNMVDRKCSGFANELLSFTFNNINGAEYCRIQVRKGKRPVWFNGIQLWVRSGCKLKQLKNDDISLFIYKRMDDAFPIYNVENTNGITQESLDAALRKYFSGQHYPVPLPKPQNPEEIDYWINWYADGSWIRTNQKLEGEQYVKHVAVTKGLNNAVVVFCYETGRVNTIKLDKFRKKANLGVRITATNRLWFEGQQPMEIFIVNQMSLLVGYSVDTHGDKHVKCHELTDFTPRKSSSNQGLSFLPDTSRVVSFHIISAAHDQMLRKLKIQNVDRTTNPGTPLDSMTCDNELKYLHELISGGGN